MALFLELTSTEKNKFLLNLDSIITIYSEKDYTEICVMTNYQHIKVLETLEDIKEKMRIVTIKNNYSIKE